MKDLIGDSMLSTSTQTWWAFGYTLLAENLQQLLLLAALFFLTLEMLCVEDGSLAETVLLDLCEEGCVVVHENTNHRVGLLQGHWIHYISGRLNKVGTKNDADILETHLVGCLVRDHLTEEGNHVLQNELVHLRELSEHTSHGLYLFVGRQSHRMHNTVIESFGDKRLGQLTEPEFDDAGHQMWISIIIKVDSSAFVESVHRIVNVSRLTAQTEDTFHVESMTDNKVDAGFEEGRNRASTFTLDRHHLLQGDREHLGLLDVGNRVLDGVEPGVLVRTGGEAHGEDLGSLTDALHQMETRLWPGSFLDGDAMQLELIVIAEGGPQSESAALLREQEQVVEEEQVYVFGGTIRLLLKAKITVTIQTPVGRDQVAFITNKFVGHIHDLGHLMTERVAFIDAFGKCLNLGDGQREGLIIICSHRSSIHQLFEEHLVLGDTL
mmetsp:Transcript_9081/g.28139  ORF Transcript_9081/g.28139 Transcript_9081/m.28139 type:complete len:437 (+) Transcript_9081:383-1693(+)